MINSSLEFI